MANSIAPEHLDEILGIQLVLAWAGESPGGEHPRLGWWKTDLIDAEAGGDLWKRLLPRTHRWAGLDASRRAARLTDEHLRKTNARADDMLTLFHFGFELDEALDERLAHHRLNAHPLIEVLPLLHVTTQALDKDALHAQLSTPSLDTSFTVLPAGRQLKRIATGGPQLLARRLACAMLKDAPASYPLPFVLNETSRGER
ncbi:BREX-6 system BrxE protein [Corallococcus macrosporus]|uniref:BREX-6 system BrxE protein n=1 Tax=Corallococcus macrosporus DSM 14697 TaxID=1189310 RepID=A0A250JVQ2_9BACT|nr:BREX-6 system BrxE protein [Corallococcus macrosporus]ATB47186.1 hypothetical protein MYMAC_002794 [Corallococcus macrosporus DSM 14697]